MIVSAKRVLMWNRLGLATRSNYQVPHQIALISMILELHMMRFTMIYWWKTSN